MRAINTIELSSFGFKASEADATQAVSGLAAGMLDEPEFAAWLQTNVTRKRGRQGWL